MFFGPNVPVRIRYGYPSRAIFFDLDGTLTDLGPNSWAVAYWKHLEQPECFYDSATQFTYGGILCEDTVQVRRLAFHASEPGYTKWQQMKITKYEVAQVI